MNDFPSGTIKALADAGAAGFSGLFEQLLSIDFLFLSDCSRVERWERRLERSGEERETVGL